MTAVSPNCGSLCSAKIIRILYSLRSLPRASFWFSCLTRIALFFDSLSELQGFLPGAFANHLADLRTAFGATLTKFGGETLNTTEILPAAGAAPASSSSSSAAAAGGAATKLIGLFFADHASTKPEEPAKADAASAATAAAAAGAA